MRTYHKIQSPFYRDPDNNYKTFLVGKWSRPAFQELARDMWLATEKIDGTNMRICVPECEPTEIGGRTDKAQIHHELYTHMQEIEQRICDADLFELTLFGEGYGAGIQKGGGDYRDDKGFILFDVQRPDGWFLERKDVVDIAAKLRVPCVEETWSGTLVEAINWFASGKPIHSYEKGDDTAEGWVLRPRIELADRHGRIITKLKGRDFPGRDGQ